jgi:hypothetical protein
MIDTRAHYPPLSHPFFKLLLRGPSMYRIGIRSVKALAGNENNLVRA